MTPDLYKAAKTLEKQLQAEKARADKAEKDNQRAQEIIASFMEASWNVSSFSLLYTCFQNNLDASKNHNKRLCDEIVGRIEAIPLIDKGYSSSHSAYEQAIDIVKSVLGGEG